MASKDVPVSEKTGKTKMNKDFSDSPEQADRMSEKNIGIAVTQQELPVMPLMFKGLEQSCSCKKVVCNVSKAYRESGIMATQLVDVLGKVSDNLTQLACNGNLKRLKFFSGTQPTPPGEKSFDLWRDGAMLVLNDWTGTSQSIKQRLLESLKSPALDVVKNFLTACPDAKAEEMIGLLEDTFGPVESSLDMLHRFHSTFQKDKESITEFLIRLEQSIRLLITRQVVQVNQVDSLRIDQFLRGSSTTNPVVLNLRDFYSGKKPPTYRELVVHVRREEADAKTGARKVAFSVPAQEKSSVDFKLLEENNQLRKELEEVRVKLHELSASFSRPCENSTLRPSTHRRTPEDYQGPQCFRCRQVGHICRDCPVKAELDIRPDLASNQCVVRQKRRKKIEKIKCYRCQKYGHTAQDCWICENEAMAFDLCDYYSHAIQVHNPGEYLTGARFVSEDFGIHGQQGRIGMGVCNTTNSAGGRKSQSSGKSKPVSTCDSCLGRVSLVPDFANHGLKAVAECRGVTGIHCISGPPQKSVRGLRKKGKGPLITGDDWPPSCAFEGLNVKQVENAAEARNCWEVQRRLRESTERSSALNKQTCREEHLKKRR